MGHLDISEKTFGKLTAKYITQNAGKYDEKWFCKCECGGNTISRYWNLLNGISKSCGCNRKLSAASGGVKRRNNPNFVVKSERLYKVYRSMRSRCFDKNHEAYARYGGRGITICQEWVDDYASFREWAMESGYNEKAKHKECTLDRIDNNGIYCPENCRWVSMKEQNNNRRSNRILMCRGESHTLSEWQDITGTSRRLIRDRLNMGWSPERAIFEPKHTKKSNI